MHPAISIPATLALVHRAWSRRSLTPLGIAVAAITAVIHAIHPWSVFFALLVVFFLGGTAVTKVKHDVKAQLTLSATGSHGGEEPRTHIQVLANSAVASILILAHVYQLQRRQENGPVDDCWSWSKDLLVVGIVAQYAAVAADTFSSELGILSKELPRLVTSPTLRQVPPGTNGGVTLLGLAAGLLGASTIAITSALLLPFCGAGAWKTFFEGGSTWKSVQVSGLWIIAVTFWGGLGSLLDSFLGGWLQASVVDIRTGKVLEGDGGKKVLVSDQGPWSKAFPKPGTATKASASQPDNAPQTRLRSQVKSAEGGHMGGATRPSSGSRRVESGLNLLDNNAINFLMALSMSLGGMAMASWYWDIPFSTIVDY